MADATGTVQPVQNIIPWSIVLVEKLSASQ